MQSSEKAVAERGGYFLTGTESENEQPAYAIYIAADTVIATLEDNGTDVKGSGKGKQNIDGHTLPAGMTLYANSEKGFTNIVLTSGSVYCYRSGYDS